MPWPALRRVYQKVGAAAFRPGRQVRVEFTGAPPSSQLEDLVQRIVGSRKSVPLRWLEEQISEALYQAELRRGGWVLDLGIWGSDAFRKEATRYLGDLRPEFGYFVEEEDIGRGSRRISKESVE